MAIDKQAQISNHCLTVFKSTSSWRLMKKTRCKRLVSTYLWLWCTIDSSWPSAANRQSSRGRDDVRPSIQWPIIGSHWMGYLALVWGPVQLSWTIKRCISCQAITGRARQEPVCLSSVWTLGHRISSQEIRPSKAMVTAWDSIVGAS